MARLDHGSPNAETGDGACSLGLRLGLIAILDLNLLGVRLKDCIGWWWWVDGVGICSGLGLTRIEAYRDPLVLGVEEDWGILLGWCSESVRCLCMWGDLLHAVPSLGVDTARLYHVPILHPTVILLALQLSVICGSRANFGVVGGLVRRRIRRSLGTMLIRNGYRILRPCGYTGNIALVMRRRSNFRVGYWNPINLCTARYGR